MNQQDETNQTNNNNPSEPSPEDTQTSAKTEEHDETVQDSPSLPENVEKEVAQQEGEQKLAESADADVQQEAVPDETAEPAVVQPNDVPLDLPDWMLPDTSENEAVKPEGETPSKEVNAPVSQSQENLVPTPVDVSPADEEVTPTVQDDTADGVSATIEVSKGDATEPSAPVKDEVKIASTEPDTPEPAEEPAVVDPEEDKKHKIKARKMSYPFNKMIANFAGCGRCSYFLAGYRVLQGELVLEKAANKMKSNQLQLPWVEEMRKLLVNAFGIHFEVDYLRFNGRCPECGRPFTYKDNSNSNQSNHTFSIQFNFKNRR
ncbi:MAG: hypothetical protein AAF490_23460 [Chloroflexota bacterium]